MPEPASDATREANDPAHALSLRLRIWTGCLGGAVIAAAGLWWIAGTRIGPRDAADPALLVVSLLAAAGAGLASGVLLALWLDHHIVGQLRGLSAALQHGAVEKLRDLPATSGWGELSALTHASHALLARDRERREAAAERERLHASLDRLRASVERWLDDERWEAPAGLDGEAAVLGAALDRGLSREREIAEQNREAVRLVRAEMLAAAADARESVEQAEKGFVEATALLTTVRELQRLGGELHHVLSAPAAPAAGGDRAAHFGASAALAIEELVTASAESVERLAVGLSRVQDIAEQVQVIGNRSTLIALNATLRPSAEASVPDDMADELRALARDVRAASLRTEDLSRQLEREVQAASSRMSDVRSSVGQRLAAAAESLGAPAPASAPRDAEDALRLMDRVREMIQDAMRKGERLSAAGERSSRAAQRLVLRLEEQVREFDGLAVRLGGAGDLERDAAEPVVALRLLASEDSAESDERGDQDAGERP